MSWSNGCADNPRRRQPAPRAGEIIEIADIPRTISGKIVELAVRNVIPACGENQDALANPQALALFGNLPQLRS